MSRTFWVFWRVKVKVLSTSFGGAHSAEEQRTVAAVSVREREERRLCAAALQQARELSRQPVREKLLFVANGGEKRAFGRAQKSLL